MVIVFTLISSLFLLIFATLVTGTIIESSTAEPHRKRLVSKLIHRDSISSPYFNPKETVDDRIERTMKTSVTRIAYLYAQTKRNVSLNDFQLNLVPTNYEPLFMVNFSMGQPPTPQLAIMDTGSNMLWVQCAPCKRCSRHAGPRFNPSRSSTYAGLPCTNIQCRYAPRADCNWLNQCTYNLSYAAGPPSVGLLATEQLIFQSSDEGLNVVPNVVFGCSHENGDYNDRRFSGIFGLGKGITSFVNQMGSRFSYCIGNIADPHYKYNQLVFGDNADFEGSSTPLQVVRGHYRITLEGISIGGIRLVIDSTTFSRDGNGNSALIDTGTAVTWLADNFYKALDNEVRRLMDGVLTPFWRGPFPCYRGTVSQDLIGFPVVTFHFAGGAELDLDTGSMFYQATPDILCMAVRQASVYGKVFGDFSVIGLMAQQYYNIAYDLNSYKLLFQRIDCELLVD
ncbi:aspartic proteinase CDR1 [Mercurialis annua]|uniref:aspartic proteinase CDR1 n=1 Tax=Mercurialis annua TaxID=3986 RepID=UPI00215F6B5B|nr:aspartic proteinase CDR1 [Mercurialis annua]